MHASIAILTTQWQDSAFLMSTGTIYSSVGISGRLLSVSIVVSEGNAPKTHSFSAVFAEAENSQKALVSYERALLWREAIDLAIRDNIDDTSFDDMTHRLAGELDVQGCAKPYSGNIQ